jgi:hypothetical protein
VSRLALAGSVFFEKTGQAGYLLHRPAICCKGRLFVAQAGYSRIGHFRASSSSLVAEIGHKNPQIRKNSEELG